MTRGWTNAMVRDFLGEPDQLKRNPHYRCAAPMKLYLLSRVTAVEATAEWQERKARADRKRTVAEKAAEKRTRALLARIENMNLQVRDVPLADLYDLAEQHADDIAAQLYWDRGYCRPSMSPEYMDRLLVNFLRHECTIYDTALDDLCGKVGKADAVDLVREKVYAAIAEAYPFLAEECERQLAERRARAAMHWAA